MAVQADQTVIIVLPEAMKMELRIRVNCGYEVETLNIEFADEVAARSCLGRVVEA